MNQRARIYDLVGYELAQAAREYKDDELALTDADDALFDRVYKSAIRRLSIKNGIVTPSTVKPVYGVTGAEGDVELHDVVKKGLKLDGVDVEYLTFDDSGIGEVVLLSAVKAVTVNLNFQEYKLLVLGTSDVLIMMDEIYTKQFTVDGTVLSLFLVLNDTDYAQLDPGFSVPADLEDAVIYFVVAEMRKQLRQEYMMRYEKDKKEFRFAHINKKKLKRPYNIT